MTTNAAPDLKEKENVSKVLVILVSVARTLESVLWQQTNVAQEVRVMELFKIQNKPNNFHLQSQRPQRLLSNGHRGHILSAALLAGSQQQKPRQGNAPMAAQLARTLRL